MTEKGFNIKRVGATRTMTVKPLYKCSVLVATKDKGIVELFAITK